MFKQASRTVGYIISNSVSGTFLFFFSLTHFFSPRSSCDIWAQEGSAFRRQCSRLFFADSWRSRAQLAALAAVHTQFTPVRFRKSLFSAGAECKRLTLWSPNIMTLFNLFFFFFFVKEKEEKNKLKFTKAGELMLFYLRFVFFHGMHQQRLLIIGFWSCQVAGFFFLCF